MGSFDFLKHTLRAPKFDISKKLPQLEHWSNVFLKILFTTRLHTNLSLWIVGPHADKLRLLAILQLLYQKECQL